MIEAPIQITAHGEGWHNIPYIRADVAQAQLDAANKRTAELEAALSDCRFVITELKTRLAEEGRDAINQKLIEKDYELRTTRSKLLERISMLLAEREWMPVGEGLPKMYTAVYVTVRTPQGKNDIDFAFMTQAGWSYHLSPRNGTVTHWMPLPPPPTEKGQFE